MSLMIPVGLTVSRASAEAAWKKSRETGEPVRPEDLQIEIDYTPDDLMTDTQRRWFSDFMLHTLAGLDPAQATTDETEEPS